MLIVPMVTYDLGLLLARSPSRSWASFAGLWIYVALAAAGAARHGHLPCSTNQVPTTCIRRSALQRWIANLHAR